MIESNGPSVSKYWSGYKLSDMYELFSNMTRKPRICTDRADGKLLVITGATSGIGYLTALKYASKGASILMVNRSKDKSESVCSKIRQRYNVKCEYIIADLSKIDDIYSASGKLLEMKDDIDVLIHNAGIYLKQRILTDDGLEMSFAVNYLSGFIINSILKDKLKKQQKGRIIFVNSEAYRFIAWGLDMENLQWEKGGYSGLNAYGASKLAQILSMHLLAQELKGSNITVNAMHPGMVRTATGRDNGPVYRWYKRNIIDRMSKSPAISAEALYYLGVSEELNGISDKFFHLTTEEGLVPPARDMEEAVKMHALSMKLGRLS